MPILQVEYSDKQQKLISCANCLNDNSLNITSGHLLLRPKGLESDLSSYIISEVKMLGNILKEEN